MKKFILTIFILVLSCSAALSASYVVNGKKQELKNVYDEQRVNVYHSSQTQNLNDSINYVDIVIDYSGSMSQWVAETKRVVNVITSRLPSSIQIGVRTFGQAPVVKKSGALKKLQNGNYVMSYDSFTVSGKNCSATYQALPVGFYSAEEIISGLNSANIGGSTPITLGLKQAVAKDFANLSQDYLKKIILITDGGENCGGNPCRFIHNLVKARKDIVVDVIYTGSGNSDLVCLSRETNGSFYHITDINSFENTIYSSISNTKEQETQNQYNYKFLK